MPTKEGTGQRTERTGLLHLPAALLLAALSMVWTWPLVLHFGDHIPGLGGDNSLALTNNSIEQTGLANICPSDQSYYR